jgi:hypothetical protein
MQCFVNIRTILPFGSTGLITFKVPRPCITQLKSYEKDFS